MSTIQQRARTVIDCEIEGLQTLKSQMDDAFEAIVNVALDTLQKGQKLIVTGIGKNLHIAEKIAATLTSTGSPAVILNPTQAVHGDLGIIQQGDLLLALSYSGESEELLNLMPNVKRLAARTVAVTGVPDSSLAQVCDYTATVTIPAEACPFNVAPTTSTTATLVWGDALAMVLLETRGFQREDYAKLHPGGAIGRSLLLRVRDIMRTAERTAVVRAPEAVNTVLLAMTRARAGLAAVVDAQGKLEGVFTDGDLRRNLESHPDILQQPVARFLSSNPITVGANELAVDVLHIFETHNIDDLVVVDANGYPVGVIDIQDLPKCKIM